MMSSVFEIILFAFNRCFEIAFFTFESLNVLGIAATIFIMYTTFRFLIRPLIGSSSSDFAKRKHNGKNHDPKNTSGTHSGD